MIAASAAGALQAQAAPRDRHVDGARAGDPDFLAMAALLGIGLLAYHVTVRFGLASLLGRWDSWAITLFRTQTTALAIAGCVALAHRYALRGAPARLRYAAAIIVGNVVAGATALALLHWTDLPYGGSSEPRWVLYIQIEYMLLAGGAVFALLGRQRARAAQARLHAAQRGRLEATRREFEARLQATQARVEPQLLFDTLANVHRLHAQGDPRAARLLDALIAYLRAATPRARDHLPSVRQEIELVRAWLTLAGSAAEGGIDQRVEVAPDAGVATLPPMLLLPLVRCVLSRSPRPGHGQPYLRLAIRVEGSRLEARVATNAPNLGAYRDEALANLRERLSALYGAAAKLELADRPRGTVEAVLELPRERVPAGPSRDG